MPDPNGAADAATVAATSAQSTEQTADSTTQAQPDGEAWRNPKEIKNYFQRVQRLEDQLGEALTLLKGRTPEQPKARSEKPPSEVEALRTELQFRDVVAEVAPHLSRAQRERLQKLHSVERPTDLETWVRSELTAVGWDKPAQSSATPTPVKTPEQVKQATNPGAPGVGGRGIDPQTLGRADWSMLPGPQARKAFDELVAKDPSIGTNFAPRAKP